MKIEDFLLIKISYSTGLHRHTDTDTHTHMRMTGTLCQTILGHGHRDRQTRNRWCPMIVRVKKMFWSIVKGIAIE